MKLNQKSKCNRKQINQNIQFNENKKKWGNECQ